MYLYIYIYIVYVSEYYYYYLGPVFGLNARQPLTAVIGGNVS